MLPLVLATAAAVTTGAIAGDSSLPAAVSGSSATPVNGSAGPQAPPTATTHAACRGTGCAELSPVDVWAPPATHRNGILLGLSLGAGIGAADGYPNDSQKVGDPIYHSSSPWMAGTRESVLVMGAIADYLNVGFWFSTARYSQSDQRATAIGIGIRVEAFPLLSLYPPLDGLGFFAQFGLGTAKLETPSRPDAQGTQSTIGTGAFYEWPLGHFLGGHLGIGPSVEFDTVWSVPVEEHDLLASLRVVFYGGP